MIKFLTSLAQTFMLWFDPRLSNERKYNNVLKKIKKARNELSKALQDYDSDRATHWTRELSRLRDEQSRLSARL